MLHQAMIKTARRAIRLRVRALYWLAVAVGDGRGADNCRTWLTSEEAQLYPPGEVDR